MGDVDKTSKTAVFLYLAIACISFLLQRPSLIARWSELHAHRIHISMGLIIQKGFLELLVHKLSLLLGCCHLKGYHGPVQQCIKKIQNIKLLKFIIKTPQALNNRIKCQLNTFSKSWFDSLTSLMLSASLQMENPSYF